MIFNLFTIVMFAFIIWVFGYTFITTVSVDRNELYVTMPYGICITALISTFLYFRCNMTTQHIFIFEFICAIGCFFILIYKNLYLSKDKKKRRALTVSAILPFFITLLAFAVLIIPGTVYGDQEYIWRGNFWDKNIYMSESLTMMLHPYSWYLKHVQDLAQISDVLAHGFDKVVNDRPTTPLLISTLMFPGKGRYLYIAYLFCELCMAMIPCTIIYFLKSLGISAVNGSKKLLVMVVAFLYPLSFWGQYIYDIDALSEMSTIAVFACVLIKFIELVCKLDKRCSDKIIRSNMILLAVLYSGAFVLYFEDAEIHFVILTVALMLGILMKVVTLRFQNIIKVMIPFIFGPLLAWITNPTLYTFIFGTNKTAVASYRQEWDWFTYYWDGIHGVAQTGSIVSTISTIENHILAFTGMFFITPAYDNKMMPTLMKGLWFLVDACLCIAIVVLMARVIALIIQKKNKIQIMYVMITLVGMILFSGMMIAGIKWSANKMLMYMSVYWYILLLFPIFKKDENPQWLILLTTISAVVLIFQVSFAVVRIVNEFTNAYHNGIEAGLKYPSDMERTYKQQYAYDFNEEDYRQYDQLIVSIDEPTYLMYVKMNLIFEGVVPYVKGNRDFAGASISDCGIYDTQKESRIGQVLMKISNKGKKHAVVENLKK